MNGDNVALVNSFGVEYIPKEIKNLIGNKIITTDIYRILTNDSKICGYFCIRFADFMLKSKSLFECTNWFSPNEYEKNDKTILKYFQ